MARTKTGKLKRDYAIFKHKKGDLIRIIAFSKLSENDFIVKEKFLLDNDFMILAICKNTTKQNSLYIKNEIVKNYTGYYPNGSKNINGYKLENDN